MSELRRGWRARLKSVLARAMRPATAPLEERLTRIESRLEAALPDRTKHSEELAWWKWLITTEEGRASVGGSVGEKFGGWQRERLRELGRCLSLASDDDLDAWCARQSGVEIGAGPFPALAAAPVWRRAVAVDPLAKAYADERLLGAGADHVVYIEAPGEDIPLAAGFADLVIIENALDHVNDPRAVVAEIFRLLRPGGLVWLLVDLSTYRDRMHPHPFDAARVRGLVSAAGFDVVHERVSDHKSHPKAYGEYRALLRRPGAPPAGVTPEAKGVRCAGVRE